MDRDDVIRADDDVELAPARLGVIGIDRSERQDDSVRQAQDPGPATLASQAAQPFSLQIDRARRPLEVGRVAAEDVDPKETVAIDRDRLVTELDGTVFALCVVQDGADRQRRKARIPAATTATIAIAYSTR